MGIAFWSRPFGVCDSCYQGLGAALTVTTLMAGPHLEIHGPRLRHCSFGRLTHCLTSRYMAPVTAFFFLGRSSATSTMPSAGRSTVMYEGPVSGEGQQQFVSQKDVAWKKRGSSRVVHNVATRATTSSDINIP
jgi:hypothetical protein